MEQFSAALKELDEQLTCSVCLNHYTSPETVSPSRPPKTLPCLHTFCLQCIEKLPKQLQVDNYFITCPTCSIPTQLPDREAASFSNAIHLYNLFQVQITLNEMSKVPKAALMVEYSTIATALDEQLTCRVCLDLYADPKFLSCLHVFCLLCIEGIRQNVQGDECFICCPSCRQPTQVPDIGAATFPAAFHINSLFRIQNTLKRTFEGPKCSCDNCHKKSASGYCKQCTQFLCLECLEVHNKLQVFCTHEVINAQDENMKKNNEYISMKCNDHNESLTFYCETCQELICRDCMISQHHRNHNHDHLSDCYPEYLEEIEASLTTVKKNVSDINIAVTNLITREREVTTQGEMVKKEIHTQAQLVINVVQQSERQLVEQSERQLVQQVNTAVQQKTQLLTKQREEAETILCRLKDCEDLVKQHLKVGSQQQILREKQNMVQVMTTVNQVANPVVFQPIEEANITFTRNQTLVGRYEGIGELTSKTFGKALLVENTCYVDKKSTVTVNLQTHDGSPFSVPLSLISCELSSAHNSQPISCDVDDTQPGNYNISFIPSTGEEYLLTIRIGGVTIPGSPFTLHAVLASPEIRDDVHVVDETVLTLTGDKECTLDWPEYGLQIDFPKGSLPSGHTAVQILVKAIVAGDFILPHDCHLVSSIYQLICPEKFNEKVTLHLRHAAIIESEEEASHFRFYAAKCLGDPPYQFNELKNGSFTPFSETATIKLRQFSYIVPGSHRHANQEYFSQIFYKRNRLYDWDMSFVIVKNDRAFKKFIRDEFCGCLVGVNQKVRLRKEARNVKLEPAVDSLNKWEMTPLIACQIAKEDIDCFTPEKRLAVPHCDINFCWTSDLPVQKLNMKIRLLGANRPNNFFQVILPPQEMCQDRIHSTQSMRTPGNIPVDNKPLAGGDLVPILEAIVEITDWYTLGLVLGLQTHELDEIVADHHKHKMISKWLDTGHATWCSLVEALKSPLIKKEGIAKQIAEAHPQV